MHEARATKRNKQQQAEKNDCKRQRARSKATPSAALAINLLHANSRGVEPRFVTFEGDDPDGYALEVNVNRRHMKPGARHLVMEMARRRANGVLKSKQSLRGTAKQADVAASELSFAAAVLDYSIADDLVQDVLSGAKGLQAAADIARERKAAKKEREAKVTRLKASANDLVKLVADDAMDIDEAIAALELRETKAREEEPRLLEPLFNQHFEGFFSRKLRISLEHLLQHFFPLQLQRGRVRLLRCRGAVHARMIANDMTATLH